MMSKLINKIQSLWSKEWLLKVISLLVAAMLWYYVGGEDIVEKNVMVPVEVINLPNNLIISNKHKKDIEVTVRGPRSLIMEMGKSQEARQIDLSKAAPGTRVEQIENDSVPVIRGLEVLRVQPSSIILSLDKLIKKEFPVNAVTTGEVKPGFVLKELTLQPESITINGPQTILSHVRIDAAADSAGAQRCPGRSHRGDVVDGRSYHWLRYGGENGAEYAGDCCR